MNHQEDDSQFFLTGVNVQNQDIEKYALTDKPHNEMDEMPTAEQMERIDEEMQ